MSRYTYFLHIINIYIIGTRVNCTKMLGSLCIKQISVEDFNMTNSEASIIQSTYKDIDVLIYTLHGYHV